MTIVDTSVWIDYLGQRSNLHTEWLESKIGRAELGLTDLILCEVLQGIRDEVVFRRVREELTNLELIETGGEALAVRSALNFRTLRSQGRTVRTTIDCLIATLCLEKGYSILHRDRDFAVFEELLGLNVIHPKAE